MTNLPQLTMNLCANYYLVLFIPRLDALVDVLYNACQTYSTVIFIHLRCALNPIPNVNRAFRVL